MPRFYLPLLKVLIIGDHISSKKEKNRSDTDSTIKYLNHKSRAIRTKPLRFQLLRRLQGVRC